MVVLRLAHCPPIFRTPETTSSNPPTPPTHSWTPSTWSCTWACRKRTVGQLTHTNAPHPPLGDPNQVDAKHVELHLDEQKAEGVVNEAVEQIAYADRVILNKTDLVRGLVGAGPAWLFYLMCRHASHPS